MTTLCQISARIQDSFSVATKGVRSFPFGAVVNLAIVIELNSVVGVSLLLREGKHVEVASRKIVERNNFIRNVHDIVGINIDEGKLSETDRLDSPSSTSAGCTRRKIANIRMPLRCGDELRRPNRSAEEEPKGCTDDAHRHTGLKNPNRKFEL